MDFGGDDVWTWNWALATVEERVFFYPVHEEETDDGEEGNDWLKRNKETDENEVVNQVDVL